MEEEAGCFVLLTNVPTAGDMAHSAREILTVYKEQHGTEQNYGFLKDPVIMNSLFLKKPARIEALGLILLLALLIWRLMERAMRTHVDSTSTPLPGWDKKVTERPTSFMMVTKFAGVIVVKLGSHRQLARPLSGVQHQYLTALDVPATCFTGSVLDVEMTRLDKQSKSVPIDEQANDDVVHLYRFREADRLPGSVLKVEVRAAVPAAAAR